MQEATGVKIGVVKNLAPKVETFEGVHVGDGHLFLDIDADHPLTTVAGHEFIHELAKTHPELYRELALEVWRQGHLDEWGAELKRLGYSEMDQTLPNAIEELVANGTGDAFTDPKFLNQLAERNPSVFGRMVDAFMRFLNRIMGGFKDLGSNKYLKDVDAFREKLLDVLSRYDPQKATALRNDAELKFSRSAEDIRRTWHEKTEFEPPRSEKIKDWTTRNVNELKPLQRLNRSLIRAGKEVKTGYNDVFGALTLLKGRVDAETNMDQASTASPATDKLVLIAKELSISGKDGIKKFVEAANDAIAGRHALERNKLLYMQTVRLTDEAETQRRTLLADVFSKKLKPEDYLGKLKETVYAPNSIIEKQSGRRMGSGIDDAEAHKLIKSAKEAGVSDAVAERINKEVLEPVRQRTLERGIESGRYTPEQRAIQQAYQFKYYMPFKGFADETPLGVDSSRRPLGAFNKDTSYMEGRTSESKNPTENLFADLAASSRDVAYNEAAEKMHNLFKDKEVQTKLGVKQRVYDMHKLILDALKGGGKLTDVDRIFRSPNAVIYNKGQYRYVYEFPEGSKELEAIKSVQKDNTLDGISKAVGRLTNLWARAKTAYSPVFDTYTALVRDTLTYPLFGAIEHSPEIAVKYMGNFARFGGPLGAWRTYLAFKGDRSFAEIEKMAKANPDSFAGWAYRLSKTGGGLEFRNELNKISPMQSLADEIGAKAQSQIGVKSAGKAFIGWLDGLATSAIATGRVSMFKALVESGMSEAEAGLYTKRLLNFQQTSEGGRRMNAYFAFWRAGITNADRLYELVHKPNGDFDRARFGKIMLVGVAAAAAWNEFLKEVYGDDAKKLTAETESKNFILPFTFNGEPVKLPMGLGLPRLMFGLGTMATRLAEGSLPLKDVLEATKNTLFENLSPLKPSESKLNATAGDRAVDLMMAVVPSAARPVAELERNQTIFGHPITSTPQPGDSRYRADSGWHSTPEEWKWLAKGLKDYTGADVYPESLQYIANSYGAGFMTELLRQFTLENKEERGRDTAVTDMPFVPRFTTGDIKYAETNRFQERRDELRDVLKQENEVRDAWVAQHPGRDKKEAPVPVALQRDLEQQKELESAVKEHSKALKAVEQNSLLSKEAKIVKLKQIQAQWEQTQKRLVQKG